MSEHRSIANPGSGLSRRDLLRRFAAAVAVAGHCTFSPEAARHVHRLAHQEREATGSYVPKFFNPHEYQMLERLAELIIPADQRSGSAKDAGAPEFIDLLCSQNQELADLYTGGLLWLDRQVERHTGQPFLEASRQQQEEMLGLLDTEARRLEEIRSAERFAVFEENTNYGGFRDYRSVPSGELGPGARFFVWLRRMTVDAFYTSPMGIADVGYRGNEFLSEYVVPEEAIEFVRKNSPIE